MFTDGSRWVRPSSTRAAGRKAGSTVGNTADASPGPREPSREGSRDAGTSEGVRWRRIDIGNESKLSMLEFNREF